MFATRFLMRGMPANFRGHWPLGNTAPVTRSRRWELKLDFRPSPEINGFNIHSLNAARYIEEDKWFGTIREMSVSRDQLQDSITRIEALPEELKQEMRTIWKGIYSTDKMSHYRMNVDEDFFFWAAAEVRHSRYGRKQQPMYNYHETAVRLSRQFFLGEMDLLKLMEQGGFLRPGVDHDRAEFAAYLETKIGKKVYVTFKHDQKIRAHTVDSVLILYNKEADQIIDHPKEMTGGKFRVA